MCIKVTCKVEIFFYFGTTKCISVRCGFQTTDGAPEQFVLQKFDAMLFCFVIDKCQTHTSDKLKKCVRTVVLCVQYVKIYTEQRAFMDSINLLFSFEETCCPIILITSRSSW